MPTWRLPAGQSLAFEALDDGVMLFDRLAGGTHLLNVTAAEALLVIEQQPGLTAAALHARLLPRLGVTEDALPLGAVDELLQWLAHLNIVVARAP